MRKIDKEYIRHELILPFYGKKKSTNYVTSGEALPYVYSVKTIAKYLSIFKKKKTSLMIDIFVNLNSICPLLCAFSFLHP